MFIFNYIMRKKKNGLSPMDEHFLSRDVAEFNTKKNVPRNISNQAS